MSSSNSIMISKSIKDKAPEFPVNKKLIELNKENRRIQQISYFPSSVNCLSIRRFSANPPFTIFLSFDVFLNK